MIMSAIPRYVTTVVLFAALSSVAFAGGRPLSAVLSGGEEVPGPGDTDGTGEVFMTLNSGQREICFQLAVRDVMLPVMAAHIHAGRLGESGGVVVPLFLIPDQDGFVSDCVKADRDLIKTIRKNPQNYYVNVHNTAFPPGAVRGQLSK